jgi:aminopeptidase
MTSLSDQQQRYAELLIKVGVNLQPDQCLLLTAEFPSRDFVHRVIQEAYRAGAKYVWVDWIDSVERKIRFQDSKDEHLEFVPAALVARADEMVDDKWARLAIVGEEFPNIYEDVDPKAMQKFQSARSKKLKRYANAQMSNQFQWCVAAVPTPQWATKVFPSLTASDAVPKLWESILKMVRCDQNDPVRAWQDHDTRLHRVSKALMDKHVRAIRYFDPKLVDGEPSTDLTVGLTNSPIWVCGSSQTLGGVSFIANMPTEEVFTSPHRLKANGWVRTSIPFFPMQREVRDAFFRFENGECVEFHAQVGEDTLKTFLEIDGAKRLGEVSLVDVRSPINQSGILFYDTLFDENAACHIAFGKAYLEAMHGADQMTEEQQREAGLNDSDAHEDFMIGTSTMHVYGICVDGSEITIMQNGQFVELS